MAPHRPFFSRTAALTLACTAGAGLGCEDDTPSPEAGHDSLVSISAEPAGDNCEFGGQRIDVGVDDGADDDATADDGVLDEAEIASTSYVCNPAPGSEGDAGFDSLVRVTALDPDPAADDGVDGCTLGGQLVEMGLDDGADAQGNAAGTARDGILADGEVDSTSYVCGSDVSTGYRVTGDVAPGDSLSLSVPAERDDLVFDAQVHDGESIIDHGDYPARHSPMLESKNFAEPTAAFRYAVNAVSSDRLSDDRFVTVFAATKYDLADQQVEQGVYFQILTEQGVAIGDPMLIEANADTGGLDEAGVAALAGGGFVALFGARGHYYAYDDSFGLVASGELLPQAEYAQGSDAWSITPFDNGLAIATEAQTDANADTWEARAQIFTKDMTPVGNSFSFLDARPRTGIAMEQLNSGGLAIVWDAYGGDTPDHGTRYGVFNPDGSAVATGSLGDSYTYNTRIAVAEDRWIVNFEIGGPDGLAYAVLDEQGDFVQEPTVWSAREPTRISAGAYEDGSFVLVYLDDESLTTVMRHVDADGQLISEEDELGWSSSFGYDAPDLFPMGNGEMLAIGSSYEHYTSGSVWRFAKGFLELRAPAPDEASLTNWAAETVKVVLSAR